MANEFWSIPAMWPGSTAVILAGGPSLSLAQVRRVALAKLDGKCKAIVVNDAVFVAWWADICHSCDEKWWMWHAQTAVRFPGIKTTLAKTLPPGWDVKRLRNDGVEGLATEPYAIRTGRNGAYQAIGIAAHAGAKRILLLGVDMKRGEDGSPRWFGDHPDKVVTKFESTMLPMFATAVGPLAERGIEVVNCSLGSAIECFPKAAIEDVL